MVEDRLQEPPEGSPNELEEIAGVSGLAFVATHLSSKAATTMNTQIQRGLAEIAKPPASEWQVLAKGGCDFGPPVLCRRPSNHTGSEKQSAQTVAQLDLNRLRNHRRSG